ncbi:hypothetical protein CTI12_AA206250 [Artemisia annua]|uniref:Myb/SANT-like domain-containing protein n=1 Tax=Artemisia annua TaxID=35608 RepID=A0A2U1P172_ARTAN|nr:hypothetical protein CTI12_AA206250 [Artemisia annua]
MRGHDDAMEWAEDCERFFLEILAERVKRHVNGSSFFTLTDWFNMDEQIFLKFAIRYVVADDTVWDKFFQRDKSFKAFKRKGCKLYPLLTEVFGDPTFASRTSEEHGNHSLIFSPGIIPLPKKTSEEHRVESAGGEAGESEGTQSDNKKRKWGGDMLGIRRMKTSSGNDKCEAFLDVWKQSMMAFTDAWSQTMAEDYSIDECMAVLEATPDVSTTSYNKALTYFLEPDWRKMFLLMPKHRRKGWLDSMQK